MKTHYRTCNICEALCGLEIKYEGDQVISIKGDEKDPLSRGHICPKAVALQDFYHDENRLRHPVKKTSNGFVEISWEEAFDTTISKIKEIQEQNGDDAVGIFLGNPNAHNLGSSLFMRPFLRALKTKNRFSASSVDQMPHHVVAQHMLGHTLLNPVPDLDRTDYLLIMGGNPLVSNGSMMSAPDIGKRLKAIRERGGKIVVIDPRKTETAKKADEHIFIRPETDAVFLLAMIHVLVRKDKVVLGHLEGAITGLKEIKSLVEKFTPERAEEITGIPAEKIEMIALEMANAGKAALYSRMGLSTQSFGGLSIWLTNVFNILNGNYDKEGGMMFSRPAIDPSSFSPKKGKPEWQSIPVSRVRKLPKYIGEVPSVSLADEIETEGPGQIKALVVVAGNPILSVPNGRRLEKAFDRLEFIVCSDIYITETSKHADIIFPAASGLEIPQFDISFFNLSIRNVVKYSPPMFPKKGNVKHDWEILKELTERLTGESNAMTPDSMLDMMLKAGYYAKEGLTLDRIKDQPHGVDLGMLKPCLMDRLQTNDDTIRLAPKVFIDDIKRLEETIERHESESIDFPLKMIGRRVLRQHNTWTQNSHRLSKGRNECTVQLHPNDASRLGIEDKKPVQVHSRVGTIELEAHVTDDIMEGVVSIPQGFGATDESSMKIAAQKNTASINDITDEMRVDLLTGNAALNGVSVRIESIPLSQLV